jgi:dTDP-4-dehydrorhamnose reductase
MEKNKKILISGSSGLLGCAINNLFTKRGCHCVALDRNKVRVSLDLSSLSSCDELFDGVEYFIHAAANTNVEQCEINPNICYRDNTIYTEFLASAARRCRIPMCYISSTGVYGANQMKPWAEYDIPRPLTHHHKSKLMGEQLVLQASCSNLVIRTGWLFGGDVRANKNFVAKRIIEAKSAMAEGRALLSNSQQLGNPTYIEDVAMRLFEFIQLGASGVYNIVNSGFGSRFDYVKEIVRLSGLAVEVHPISADSFNRIAPVSNNEMAINWRSDAYGIIPMRSWNDSLSEYFLNDEIKELLK